MFIFEIILPATAEVSPDFTLALTADERTKTRQRLDRDGRTIFLRLPRGQVLQPGDLIQAPQQQAIAQIQAQPEPVLTVRAPQPLALMQAAYHLGNRHVPLEIHTDYLRLQPDPVLEAMLIHRGIQVIAEIAPFLPETGAYGHHHE